MHEYAWTHSSRFFTTFLTGSSAAFHTLVVNQKYLELHFMDRNSPYFSFWVRGLWVFLMLLITNIFLGLVAAAIGSIVRGLSGSALWWSYLFMMLIIGLPFMGWIFEKFASKLPRLPVAESPRDVAT
jgi:hypothetical protein